MLKSWSTYLIVFLITSMTHLQSSSLLVPGALTHEKKVSLKETIESSIPIQNDGDTPIKVRVTLSDYSFNFKGESSFPEKGSTSRSNATWIKTNKTFFEVAPHTTYSFPYTIDVPSDPSLQGSYWSIFLIEPVEEQLATPDQDQSLGVQTIVRYGVQVLTHIGQSGEYNLKVLNKKITKEGEKKTFFLDVDNIGTLAQSPLLTLELINSLGKKMGRFECAKQRILPTCSTSYQVDLSTVPAGKYKAMVILDHGDGALFGAQYDLVMD
jgi:hypothetical protein